MFICGSIAALLLGGCQQKNAPPLASLADAPPEIMPLRTPAEPVEADVYTALHRGVEFLIASQNEDGSWGTFETRRTREVYLGTVASHRAFQGATSALAVMALQRASHDDRAAFDALRRGVEFFLTTEPIGRAMGSTFYNTWAHTYTVQALSRIYIDDRFAADRDRIAEVLQREIDILIDLQGADGGWGYYDFGWSRPTPTGDQSTSFNTAAILLAFREAARAGFETPESVILDGIDVVERLRLPSGAYVYGTYAQMRPGALFNWVKGSLGRSQPCNLALWLYERDITLEELLAGLEHMHEHHHFMLIGKGRPVPHEAWYATAGYYFFFGHFYAALVTTELPPEQRDEHRAWLTEVVWRTQHPDGSWFDFPFYGYHKEYGTAYAVLILQETLGLND